MVKKFLFSLIFLLLILPVASASFTIETEMTTNSVCPTHTIVIQDIVTSNVNAPYSVTISGPAASFTTAVPPGFYLQQGQSQTIYLYITPPSTTSPGTYELTVTVESQGQSQQVNHDIIVENCHITSLTASEHFIEICSCDETEITLELENQGRYLEEYEIFAEGQSSWITISPKEIDLLPDGTIEIVANIEVPCGKQGTYEITFIAEAKNSIAEASDTVTIEVYSCYDFTLSPEKTYYEVCEKNDIIIPVSIKNLGTQDNIYKINLDGESWINSDAREISIKKNEVGSFNINVAPPLRTMGIFNAEIEVMSLNGKVIKVETIEIDAVKCYDHSINIVEEKEIICNGLSSTYSVTLENLGKFNAIYSLNLDAPSWVTLDDYEVPLEAGKKKFLSLSISPPENAFSQDYTIKIIAEDTETKLKEEDLFIVSTATQKQCFQPEISSEKELLEVPQDSTATALFIIENKGTQEATYDIVISGTATQFSQINPGSIVIEPAKAENLYLYIAPSPDIDLGTYTVTVTARLTDSTILASKTITITVIELAEKEEQEQAGIDLTKMWDKIVNFFKNIFTFKQEEQEVVIIGEGEAEAEAEAEAEPEEPVEPAEGESEAEAEAEAEAEPEEPAEPAEGESEIEEPLDNSPYLIEDIPNIKIPLEGAYTFDLNEYFADPNNDNLFFTAVKPLDITLQMIQNVVTIKPDEGFQGERTIIFYASDGTDTVSSNEITIIVGEVQQEVAIDFSELLYKYRYYLIGAAIIIVIIIILLSGFGEKIVDFFEEEVNEKPKDKEVKEEKTSKEKKK